MNDQQLFQIEQRIQHIDMLLHHFPSDAFKRNAKEYAALLQANEDLRTLIHEVKMASKSFRVVLTDELHRKCKMKSAATDKTVTDVCREALTNWVDRQHPIIMLPEDQPNNLSTQALADIYSDITVTEAAEDQPDLSTSAQADKK